MMRVLIIAALVLSAVPCAGCDLSPQPLPPIQNNGLASASSGSAESPPATVAVLADAGITAGDGSFTMGTSGGTTAAPTSGSAANAATSGPSLDAEAESASIHDAEADASADALGEATDSANGNVDATEPLELDAAPGDACSEVCNAADAPFD